MVEETTLRRRLARTLQHLVRKHYASKKATDPRYRVVIPTSIWSEGSLAETWPAYQERPTRRCPSSRRPALTGRTRLARSCQCKSMLSPCKPWSLISPPIALRLTNLDSATQQRFTDVLETRGADPQQQALRTSFLASIKFPSRSRVLEVGCGTGVLAARTCSQ